jgi:hypothetical protein
LGYLEHRSYPDAPAGGAEWDRAYGVVSLYDVLRFAAHSFWKSAEILTELRESPELYRSPSRAKDMAEALAGLTNNLHALGLPVSVKEIQKFNRWMNEFVKELLAIEPLEKQKEAFLKTRDMVSTKLEQLGSVIQSELEDRVFVHIPSDQAKYFGRGAAFGEAVNDRFPSTAFDINEAGNCIAFGRPTACVFHLMRVLEVGLKAFSFRWGIPYAPSWESYLKQINKLLAMDWKDKPDDFKQNEVFIRGVAGDILTIKHSWRNPTIHSVSSVYTPEEASKIFDTTMSLMSALAAHLKELTAGQAEALETLES